MIVSPHQILYNDRVLMLDMEENLMIMILYICIEVIFSWILEHVVLALDLLLAKKIMY